MTARIRLSPAQASALECRMHGEEQVDGLEIEGRHLLVQDPRETFWAITDAANSEDAQAREDSDPEARRYARRACGSLTALAGKVAKLEATP